MKKDYSEYTPTKNEIYNLSRSDGYNVRLAYFNNYARFSKDDKQIHIAVDYGKEYFSMNRSLKNIQEKNSMKKAMSLIRIYPNT